ncbi:MAG TPA: glycosyltransferase [Lactobacillaceae bacterium]|jgi:poly(glycerol-phosphate) alpha-glucosyltransferase
MMTSDKQILILTTTFQQKFGGRTKSLLQRARILADHDYRVTVYSTNQNDNYQTIFDLYHEKGHVLADVTIGNLFEELGKFDGQVTNNYQDYLMMEFGDETDYERQVKGTSVQFLKQGEKVFSLRYVDETHQKLKSIDSFQGVSQSRPFKRAILNDMGNVKRVRYYLPGTWQLHYQEYVTQDLRPFARLVLEDDKKLYQHIDENGVAQELVTFKRFIAQALNKKVTERTIIINDARGLDYPVRLINKDILKIFVIHNPHLNDPLNIHSGIKGSFSGILRSDLKPNEQIVALTDDQKASIVTELPVLDQHIQVIGHAAFDKGNVRLNNNKTYKVGIIGRLAEQKNLKDAIAAFAIFHQRHPEYQLEIYGKGDLEQALQAQVSQLKLDEAVVFHGFTDNVDQAYQAVDFTLNTSFYEGFPLAIIESIANGTPVISYPVNFGPATILDRTSGRIAKERTPEALANEMEQEHLAPKVRQEVFARSQYFSVEKFYERWQKLLQLGE